MINSIEIGYIFSKDELILLASLLGNNELYGIDENENIAMLSKDEAEEKGKKIISTLEKKKYILADKNEIKIDKSIAELINVCCKPKAIINFLYRHSAETRIYIYIAEDFIVLMELMNNDNYVITPVENIRDLITKISDVIDCIPVSNEKSNEEIKFNKFDYYSFMAANNLKDVKKSKDFLIAKGMSSHSAEVISSSFIEKNNYISMCSYNNVENYESLFENIIFIPVDNYMYLVSSYLLDDEVMVIKGVQEEEYEAIIENLISKAAK